MKNKIALPYTCTLDDIPSYLYQLRKETGINSHPYLTLDLDRTLRPIRDCHYGLTKITISCISPSSYIKKTRSLRSPGNETWIVSIDVLKEKIKELEDWYENELKLKEKKNQEQAEIRSFYDECKAVLPTRRDTVDGTHWHWFEVTNLDQLDIKIIKGLTKEQAIKLDEFLTELFNS